MNWDAPRTRKPGRQRKYSNHAIETAVTLGLVFGLASRQTEGFLRSLLALLDLDNEVPDHTTISRRKAKLGKVTCYKNQHKRPVHILIDSSGLAVHVGQLHKTPKSRDYRKLHLCVDEETGDVVACELTSKRARDSSRVASLVGQDRQSHRIGQGGHRIRCQQRLRGARESQYSSLPEGPDTAANGRPACTGVGGHKTAKLQYSSAIPHREAQVAHRIRLQQTEQDRDNVLPLQDDRGFSDASERACVTESRGKNRVQDSEHHDGARDARWRDDGMKGVGAKRNLDSDRSYAPRQRSCRNHRACCFDGGA